jgi:acyl carrier protein
MPDDNMAQKVKSVLAKEWGLRASDIPDTAALNEYEKWDSLGHITIMLALEKEFGIEVTADNIQSLSSVGNIVAFLKKQPKSTAPRS